MRRFFIAALFGAFFAATPAFAADAAPTMAALVTSDVVVPDAAAPPAPNFSSSIEARLRRPALLPSLYIASAALQGYDAYSTLAVLKHGGVEANPLMKNVTKSPIAFVALKATVAATSIMAAEKMWKNGNRIGAIGVMVASNVAMGFVAANNARVLASVR